MMKKNKTQIIVSSIVTILPMVAGLFMWNILPDRMTTHWGMSGEADGFSSKAFAVFVLPLILLATHWLCIFFTLRDPKNKEQSSKVFAMIMWIIPITDWAARPMDIPRRKVRSRSSVQKAPIIHRVLTWSRAA